MMEENETTVGELVRGRRGLEDEIAGLLRAFEERYGVEARGLSMFRVRGEDDGARYVVSVDLRV